MTIDKKENPDFLNNYITYLAVTKALSERTVTEYYMDIRLFLRYLAMKDKNITNKTLEEISIKDVTIERLDKVKLSDIYDYLYYLQSERGNNVRARSRKVSALKGLFKYLYKNIQVIHQNPMDMIEIPNQRKSLPKYLQLDECEKMLSTMEQHDNARDICIITLFLNCGMRLSELVGLNLSDISFEEMRMRVTGKGSKERYIFLNKSCVEVLKNYLAVRPKSETDPDALFLSSRGKRISKRRVQQVVENSLKESGLGGRGLSTHKLRHTAATLMYTYGGADMMTLKEILGHENVSTTEIYTHISPEKLRNVAESMPFENDGEKKNK